MKFRPKSMAYKSYKAMCKAQGSDPMAEDAFKALPEQDDEDDGSGAEGVNDGDEGNFGKGDVSVLDLLKSIDAMDTVMSAAATSGNSRETYLRARLDAGTITKSELSELGDLFKGGTPQAATGERFAKSIIDEETPAGRLVDASDFLKSMTDGINDRLTDIGTEVAREATMNREMIKAVGGLLGDAARVIHGQGELIKAMGARLGIVERQPAPRRSQGTHDPRDVRSREMAKSGNGGNDDGKGRLSRAQVNGAMEDLLKKAESRGDNQAIDSLVQATALFETSGRMHPNIEAAVRSHLGSPS